jgi:hypothetical protein
MKAGTPRSPSYPDLIGTTRKMATWIDLWFECFGQHMEAKGYIAGDGQIVDATIVPENSFLVETYHPGWGQRPAAYAARASADSSVFRFRSADSAGHSLSVRVSLSDSTISQAPENIA